MRKGAKILEYLNQSPRLSDREIARRTKSSPAYVQQLRRKMVHVEAVPEPGYDEAAEITQAPTEVAAVSDVDSLAVVLEERGLQYGSFMAGAQTAIQLKGAIHNAIARNDLHLYPDALLALDMIAVKISRIVNGNPDHLDGWTDIAGYAKLVADRIEGNLR